jgi:hypothetical protein
MTRPTIFRSSLFTPPIVPDSTMFRILEENNGRNAEEARAGSRRSLAENLRFAGNLDVHSVTQEAR